MSSKKALTVIAALTGLMAFPIIAQAQEVKFPIKPITLVIPYSVGGGTDVQARLVAPFWEKRLGQPIVVENKAGGAGAIAHREVSHGKPDGYTVLCSMFPDNPILVALKGKELGFANEDFVVLGSHASTPGALSVRQDSPFKTIQDFVEYAKKNPGKATVSLASPTWQLHLFDLEDEFKIDLNPIMFKGGGEVLNAVRGGHVMALMGGGHFVIPGPETGLRPLVVTGGTKRFEKWPDVPSMTELGYEMSYELRRIFCVRKGTPEPIVKKLTEALMDVGKDPEFITKLKGMGEIYEPSYGNELQKYYEEMCQKIATKVEKRKAEFGD